MRARRAARQGPRLLEGPTLFRRTRRDVADLVGCVWLAVELARFARSRLPGRRTRTSAT
jgi:hypothetical protein